MGILFNPVIVFNGVTGVLIPIYYKPHPPQCTVRRSVQIGLGRRCTAADGSHAATTEGPVRGGSVSESERLLRGLLTSLLTKLWVSQYYLTSGNEQVSLRIP